MASKKVSLPGIAKRRRSTITMMYSSSSSSLGKAMISAHLVRIANIVKGISIGSRRWQHARDTAPDKRTQMKLFYIQKKRHFLNENPAMGESGWVLAPLSVIRFRDAESISLLVTIPHTSGSDSIVNHNRNN